MSVTGKAGTEVNLRGKLAELVAKMSFQAMAWAVAQPLKARDKIVLLMLANRAGVETPECWPSVPRLAAECGLSVRATRAALRALECAELVSTRMRKTDTECLSSAYRLNTDFAAPPAGGAAPPRQEVPGETIRSKQEEEHAPVSKEEAQVLVVGAKKRAPHDPSAMLALFAQKLPMLPQPRGLTPARRQKLAARWRDSFGESLEVWVQYLDRVAASAFLTGRTEPAPGHSRWRCDLDFLLRPEKILSIAEGKYDDPD